MKNQNFGGALNDLAKATMRAAVNRRALLRMSALLPLATLPQAGHLNQSERDGEDSQSGRYLAPDMQAPTYQRLSVRVDRGVAFVTIDNPPVNIQDPALVRDLYRVADELDSNDAIRVAVFQSAVPDYFMAHLSIATNLVPTGKPFEGTDLWWFQQMIDRVARLKKVTIAKIEGRARGGGSEFVLALDLRYGALGQAILGQPEINVDELPGGGGTQRLTRLIGRGRALEALLSGGNFSAELAERYGYLNRAFPPEELTPFVEGLAYRIGQFSPKVIAWIKDSVQAAEPSITNGIAKEAFYFLQAATDPAVQEKLKAFLEAGGETPQVERDLGGPPW